VLSEHNRNVKEQRKSPLRIFGPEGALVASFDKYTPSGRGDTSLFYTSAFYPDGVLTHGTPHPVI
jgi:hypothetical protein